MQPLQGTRRKPIYRKNPDELIEYDRYALRQGHYSGQRARLCGLILLYFFLAIIIAALLGALVYFTIGSEPISPLYLMELLWSVSMTFTVLVVLAIFWVALLLAFCSPKKLLSRRWQTGWYLLFETFVIVFIAEFVLVAFVDLLQFPLKWGVELVGIRFRDSTEASPEETPAEAAILAVGRICQVTGCILIVILLYLREDFKKEKKSNTTTSSSLLKLLESPEHQLTWKQLQEFDARRKPDAHECAICLSDYLGIDEVVQLTCHRNHVFHLKCMKQFLENVRDKRVGKPCCALCQRAIALAKK